MIDIKIDESICCGIGILFVVIISLIFAPPLWTDSTNSLYCIF